MPEQLPVWLSPGVEPPESLKTNGWQPGMKPAAQHFDWLFNRIYAVLKELQDGGDLTLIEQKLATLEQDVTTHLAESNAHSAENISFSEAGITATNVKDAVIQAFQLGNSKKQELVDKLLLLDPSLPITPSSDWEQILTLLGDGTFNTGKKWKVVTQLSSSINTYYATANSNYGNNFYYVTIDLANLGFVPTKIIVTSQDKTDLRCTTWFKDNYYINGADYCNTYIQNNGYRVPYIAGTVLKIPVVTASKLYVCEITE